MPNYVFNKMYLKGKPEEIRKLKDFVSSEESCFDFNKIIPMPEELNLSAGSEETVAEACAYAKRKGKTTCKECEPEWTKEKTFDEWAALGEKYIHNKTKYGASNWYDWCCKNWGTKWNACDPCWSGDDFVSFETAWSAPLAIYEQLTKLFPNVSFNVDYADEDLGNNCGTVSWDETLTWIPQNDFNFACDVWGYDPSEMEEEYEVM